MKVTREQKSYNREMIIDTAARCFRKKGFDGIGVADLMKEAGLTQGGFYRHFASKEELIVLATQRGMQQTNEILKEVVAAAPDRPLDALVKFYLGRYHSSQPEIGCLLAALGSDLSRQPDAVRSTVEEQQQKLLELIAEIVPGKTKTMKRKHAIAVLSRLVGALVLSRVVSDPKVSAEILRASDDLPKAVRREVRR